ncbi:MAG: cysteine desulfurase-like protein [Rhizobiales bacterium 65-9]|nr:cysteine desulfurase-like protein [Hyphomicrobiales bacterium]OJY32906.1 MAG: cysteine desulfurase-like protein [Rhizobiales bacterium 65-9]
MSDSLPAGAADGATEFPVAAQRAKFPALARAGDFIFFDNAAGAQIPQGAFDAVNDHLLNHNVQRGGPYDRSRAVDASVQRGRESVADFLNARDPSEICFGMNATSFIRLVSLGVAQTISRRNEIVVTDLDHDANVATWLALERMGVNIVWWKMRDGGVLDVNDLKPLVNQRTRLVACTVVSHALGSLVDVAAAARIAHAAGADIFLDCVHYSPHAPIDVQAWDCDFLVCSGYKAFAPHMGFLYGKREKLVALPTFREDFIPNEPPYKVEAGTFIYENVAGMDAAIAYLAELGATIGGRNEPASRRENLLRAMTAIKTYETRLSRAMLEALHFAGATVYGVSDAAHVDRRVPTFAFNLPGVKPLAICDAMSDAGIGIREGHMYTPRLMRRLGVSPETGVVRASLVHYNTLDEVKRFGEVLKGLRAR